MKKVLTLMSGDLRNISRDIILLMSFFAPVLLMVFLEYGLPFFNTLLEREFSFTLELYYPLIVSMFNLFIPMMIGMMAGFMILDERDEEILLYLSITPLSKTRYLIYRLIAPVCFSLVLSTFLISFLNIIPINILRTIPVLILASLEAPFMALFLGVFASNKVEGMAYSKAMGILLLAPLAGHFLDSPWQYLAGIVPTFWPSKALLSNNTAAYLGYLFIGGIIHLFYISILAGKLQKRIG